jgi:hypothetical protein
MYSLIVRITLVQQQMSNENFMGRQLSSKDLPQIS